MTINDVRLLMEVTTRKAEEMFTRQLEECDRRIERHRAASRLRLQEGPKRKSPSRALQVGAGSR